MFSFIPLVTSIWYCLGVLFGCGRTWGLEGTCSILFHYYPLFMFISYVCINGKDYPILYCILWKIKMFVPNSPNLLWSHTGWCFNLSEKYESELGWLFPIYMENWKMFQTTNQFISCWYHGSFRLYLAEAASSRQSTETMVGALGHNGLDSRDWILPQNAKMM